jgi:hypothetical protein
MTRGTIVTQPMVLSTLLSSVLLSVSNCVDGIAGVADDWVADDWVVDCWVADWVDD